MNGRRPFFLGKLVPYTFLWLYVVFTLAPVLWTLSTSMKNAYQVYSIPPIWFPKPSLDNYVAIFTARPFGQYTVNSVAVSLVVTAICLTVGTMAAYGFSAFGRRRAIQSMFGLIIGSRMIPPVCLIVPYALIFSRTGLTDTPFGLILACTSFQLPFAIWVMKSSFDTIPQELDEAAKIDGGDVISCFFHISLPIARTGIATGGIMAFLFTWNEFVFAALLTRTAASKTLPIGITDFQMDDYIQWNLLAAAVICSVLPALVFIALFQKNIMSGAIAGAVKG